MYRIIHLSSGSTTFTGTFEECGKHFASLGFPGTHTIQEVSAAPAAPVVMGIPPIVSIIGPGCAISTVGDTSSGPDGDPVVKTTNGWTDIGTIDYDTGDIVQTQTPPPVVMGIPPLPSTPYVAPAVEVVGPVGNDWRTGVAPSTYGNLSTGAAGTVSDVAVERQLRQRKILAESCGIVTSEPMYARGTRCVGEGNRKFRELRVEWEQAPEVGECVEGLRTAIQDEERVHTVVPAHEIRMRDDGAIIIPGNGVHVPERRVFSSLMSTMRMRDTAGPAFPNAAAFLALLPPDERADVFNAQMGRVADKQVMIHTRNNAATKDGRAMYALTGPTYPAVGADQICDGLSTAVDFNGSRGYLKYDPESTDVKLDALWMPEQVTDLSAGDVFKFGARFRTNDAGGGAVKGGGIAYQNDCLNLQIISESYAPEFRLVHKGTMQGLRRTVQQGMAKVMDGFKPLLEDWGIIGHTSLPHVELWGERFTSTADALTWAVKNGKLGAGLAEKVAVEVLLSGYAGECSAGLATGSLQDVVNAVTRAAWMATMDDCTRHVMERDAGALVPVLARAAQA